MATSDHPKDWVRRMVSNRGLNPPAKTLYWWSIHIEGFLAYCKKAGPLASERPECSAPLFLSSINRLRLERRVGQSRFIECVIGEGGKDACE